MDRQTPGESAHAGESLLRNSADAASPRHVYLWSDPLPCPDGEAANLLGGKGASLRLLSNAGLSVPPAFTLTIETCRQYHAAGRTWPAGLWEEIRSALDHLEKVTGRKYGRGPQPLTLAVRSGAAESMPGLMSTFLHCGLTESLAREINDEPTWKAFAEFLDSYAPLRGHNDRSQRPLGRSFFPAPREYCERWLEYLAGTPAGPLPDNSESLLREVISAVFDSWENPAAQQFRELVDWKAVAGTSVTVQVMFESELSGVVFSRHPHKSHVDDLVVEVVSGLGRQLLAGQLTPIRSTIERSRFGIRESTAPDAPHERQLLAEFVQNGLQSVCKAAIAMESTFNAAVDMEFGFSMAGHPRSQGPPGNTLPGGSASENLGKRPVNIPRDSPRPSLGSLQSQAEPGTEVGNAGHDFVSGSAQAVGEARGPAASAVPLTNAGQLVFFQVRPIGDAGRQEQVRLAERRRLLELAKRGQRFWVQHNLSDTLPTPSPLTWDLWRKFMTGAGGFGLLHRQLGYRPTATVCRDGFLELIAGRIYADPDRLVQMYCAGFPLRFDHAVLRKNPHALNAAPNHLDLSQLDPWFLLRWPMIAWTTVKSGYRQRQLIRSAAIRFERDLQPRIRAWVEKERQVKLHELSIGELVALFDRRCHDVFDEIALEALLPGTLGVAIWNSIQRQLQSLLGEKEANALANEILSMIPNPTLVRQRELLRQINDNEASRTAFLREFGHRGPNEMDLASPRWREIPQSLGAAARSVEKNHSDTNGRTDPGRCLQAALEQTGAGCLYRDLSERLRQATTLLPFREIGKQEFLIAYDYLRAVVNEIGQRTGLGNGVHYLHASELHDLAASRDLRQLVAQRRHHFQACRKLFVPAVIAVENESSNFDFDFDFGAPPTPTTPTPTTPTPTTMGRTIPGTPLSRGQVTGRVLLISESISAVALSPDTVVVASTIDTGWLPFLANAAALVVEQGGTLSHIALLARTLEIPAIVCERISEIVVDGERIRVDADHGVLEFPDRLA